jgi:hypothetical protein
MMVASWVVSFVSPKLDGGEPGCAHGGVERAGQDLVACVEPAERVRVGPLEGQQHEGAGDEHCSHDRQGELGVQAPLAGTAGPLAKVVEYREAHRAGDDRGGHDDVDERVGHEALEAVGEQGEPGVVERRHRVEAAELDRSHERLPVTEPERAGQGDEQHQLDAERDEEHAADHPPHIAEVEPPALDLGDPASPQPDAP